MEIDLTEPEQGALSALPLADLARVMGATQKALIDALARLSARHVDLQWEYQNRVGQELASYLCEYWRSAKGDISGRDPSSLLCIRAISVVVYEYTSAHPRAISKGIGRDRTSVLRYFQDHTREVRTYEDYCTVYGITHAAAGHWMSSRFRGTAQIIGENEPAQNRYEREFA